MLCSADVVEDAKHEKAPTMVFFVLSMCERDTKVAEDESTPTVVFFMFSGCEGVRNHTSVGALTCSRAYERHRTQNDTNEGVFCARRVLYCEGTTLDRK